MKIYAVKYAESAYGDARIFRGGQGFRHPLSFKIYLIIEGDRQILVDAGCNSMCGWDMRHFLPPQIVMARDGLCPDRVTDIIVTHAHHDHIQGVSFFKNARIYIQEDEYNLGKRYIPEGREVVTFKDECEIIPGVTAKKMATHSAGSSIVVIDRKTKPLVISGDEVYYRDVLMSKEKQTVFTSEYSKPIYDVHIMHEQDGLPGANGIWEITE